jgi:tetratricopeptide (TPR) repeat protein
MALASYANQEAEDYCRRGLELEPAESRRVQLLSGLGEALFRQSRFQEAIRTWREGIELYRALGDSDGVARLYARSAWAANYAYDPTESLQLCMEGLAMVKGAPESPGLARLLHRTARAYQSRALLEEGRTFAQRALEMAERLGEVEVQAHALTHLGGSFLRGENALEALAKAVKLAESNGLLRAASDAHGTLGYATMIYRGVYCAGREHFQRAVELAGQEGRTASQIGGLSSLVFYALRFGEFEEAEAMLSRIRALQEELTEPSWAAEAVLYSEMWYQGLSGEWEACIRQARARQASARERGADPKLAWAKHWLAWATLESRRLGDDAQVGGWEEAEAALVEAIEIYDRSSMPMYAVEMRVWLGSLRVTQGRLGDARRLLAEAREKATVQPVVFDEPHLLLLEAQLASAEERWAEALAAFEAAVGILDHFGVRWYRARWLLDWAEAHVARGQATDIEQACALLLDAQTAFEEMGIPRYVALAQNRLQALRATEEPANWQTQEP